MDGRLARVLVPVSGSSMDEEVVSLACEMVRASKGIVWVLYVIQVTRALPLDAEVPAETARGERVLQQMEKLGRAGRFRVEGEILQARSPGPAIIREAVDRDVDLIVTAMPYKDHYGTPTMGELVPYLLKHSRCRVLVYREEAEPASAGRRS